MDERVKGLAGLGEEVSRSLEEARVASGGAARVRMRLVADPPKPKRRAAPKKSAKKTRYLAVVAAAALAAAALPILAHHRAPEPRPDLEPVAQAPVDLTFEHASEKGLVGAFLAAPPAADLPLTFSDGTRIVLSPSTRARVSQIGPKGARLLVESGKLHADVVHTGDAKWAVEAGPFEVRVTGTSFDLAFDPRDESIVVSLAEGSVVVTGCMLESDGRRVSRGEQLHVSCKQPPTTVTPSALPDAVPTPTAKKSAPAPSAVVTLAKEGKHAEAIAAAEAQGFGVTCDSLTGAELLVLADAARYAGKFDRAGEALLAARRRFPKSDAAASAAFELGRIAFDVRHDLDAAGDWFDTYLAERPNGPLAREATGRALEARHRAGDGTRAERMAVRYLAAYPDGPHAQLARKIIAQGGVDR